MAGEFVEKVIESVLDSQMSFCKFLAANETGKTGSNQCGVLVSRSAERMLFSPKETEIGKVIERTIEIKWQDDFITQSCFKFYKSKGELRITRFGKGFPFLKPEQTGDLFVFIKNDHDSYSGYFLDTEDDIDHFLSTFGISPAETNQLIDVKRSTMLLGRREEKIIQEFIKTLKVEFPGSENMSAVAREIENKVHNHIEYIQFNPDKKIIDWTNMEYKLFKALEYERYKDVIIKGFSSVDEFVKVANIVLNRRKSRAGKSLEHHLSAIFDGNSIQYASQVVTEGNKRPDFLFPSKEAYHDLTFPSEKIISLAAKTTCKDRWRQILNEADRLKGMPKYLCTLQQGISGAQMDEMQKENVILVVPQPFIDKYPVDRQDRIWTLARFIEYVKAIEGR